MLTFVRSSIVLSVLAVAAGCASSTQPPPQTSSDVHVTGANVVSPVPPDSPPLATSITTAPPNNSAGMLAPVADPATAPATASALSDAQVTAILEASIQTELTEARFAAKHAKTPEAKALADRLAADEGQAGADLTAFQARHPMVAQGTDMTAQIHADGTRTMSSLHGLHGLAFDQAFIDAQVARSTSLAQLLDGTLIASAADPELRSELTTLRAMVSAHARMAAEAQATLREHTGQSGPSTTQGMPAPADAK